MNDWQAFANFMNLIEEAKTGLKLQPHQECFYRGHANTNYQLLPSLFRQNQKSEEDYWKLERRMFYDFQNRAVKLYERDHSDWDILFHMQHHGVPTRLLDWTSVLGVAIYFALLDYDDNKNDNPCIWLLNPYALNHATWGYYRLFNTKYLAREEEKNRSYEYGELLLESHPAQEQNKKRVLWDTPLAINDHQRSERMFAQSGWFTIHGNDMRPIEETFKNRDDIIRKIEIPTAVIQPAKSFLDFAGINHNKIFPDLDGLAKSICERYGLRR